jgi:hypothetical protein
MDRKALAGYTTPSRQNERVQTSLIHTDAYDRDAHLLPKLQPLTANELRLFKQGGADAVIADRQFHARERGDVNWREIGKDIRGA